MGIEVVYRRLPESEFESILADPEKGRAFMTPSLPGFDLKALSALGRDPEALFAKKAEILAAFAKQREDPKRVDLQKDWQALHFLLTGDSSREIAHRSDEPLHNVVMGGHPTSLKAGYDFVRRFSIEDVRAIARELAKISVEDLRKRFSADAFNQAKIYPNPRPQGWDERGVEYVFHIFPKLVRFFEEAANAGEIVVVYAE